MVAPISGGHLPDPIKYTGKYKLNEQWYEWTYETVSYDKTGKITSSVNSTKEINLYAPDQQDKPPICDIHALFKKFLHEKLHSNVPVSLTCDTFKGIWLNEKGKEAKGIEHYNFVGKTSDENKAQREEVNEFLIQLGRQLQKASQNKEQTQEAIPPSAQLSVNPIPAPKSASTRPRPKPPQPIGNMSIASDTSQEAVVNPSIQAASRATLSLDNELKRAHQQMADLETQLTTVQKKFSDQNTAQSSLLQQNRTLNVEIAQIQEQLQLLSKEVLDSRSAQRDAQNKIKPLEQTIAQLTSALESNQSQLTQSQSRSANLETQLTKIRSHLEEQARNNEALQTLVTQSQAHSTTLNANLQQLKEQQANLLSQLSMVTREKNEFIAKNKALEQLNRGVTSQLKQAQGLIQKVQLVVAQKDEEIARLTAELKHKKATITSLETALATLNKKNRQLDGAHLKKMQALGRTQTTLNEKIQKLENGKDKDDSLLANLRKELGNVQQQQVEAQSTYQRDTHTLTQEREALTSKLANVTKENLQLKQELVHLKSQTQEQEKEIIQLKRDKAENAKQLAMLSLATVMMEKQLTLATTELEERTNLQERLLHETTGKLNAKELAISHLREANDLEITSLRERIRDLEIHQSTLTAKHASQEASWEISLEHQQQELAKLTTQNDQLERALFKAQSDTRNLSEYLTTSCDLAFMQLTALDKSHKESLTHNIFLQSQLEKLQGTYEERSRKVTDLQEQNTQLSSTIESLKEAVFQKETQLEGMKKEKETTAIHFQDLAQRLHDQGQLSSELQVLKGQLRRLETIKLDTEEKFKAMETVLGNQEAKIQELQRELSKTTSSTNALTLQLTQARQEAETAKRTLEVTTKQYTQANQELTTQLSQSKWLTEEQREDILKLKATIADKERLLSNQALTLDRKEQSYTQEYQGLKQDIESLKVELERALDTLSQKDLQFMKQRDEMAQLEVKLMSATKETEGLRSTVQTLNNRVKEQISSQEHLSSQIDRLTQANQILSSQVELLTQRNTELTQDLVEVSERNRSLESSNANLLKELASVISAKDVAMQESIRLQAQLTQSTNLSKETVTDLTLKLETLNTQLQEQEKQIRKLRDEKANIQVQLEQNMATAESAAIDFASQVSQLNATTLMLKQELSHKDASIEQLRAFQLAKEEENRTLINQKAQLTTQLDSSKQENQQLKEKQSVLLVEIESLVSQLKKLQEGSQVHEAARQAYIKDISDRLSLSITKQNELSQELAQSTSNIEDLKSQLETVTRRDAESHQIIEQLRGELAVKESQNTKLVKSINDLTSEFQSEKERTKDLQAQLEVMTSQRKEKDDNIKRLEESLSSMQQQFASQAANLLNLQDTLNAQETTFTQERLQNQALKQQLQDQITALTHRLNALESEKAALSDQVKILHEENQDLIRTYNARIRALEIELEGVESEKERLSIANTTLSITNASLLQEKENQAKEFGNEKARLLAEQARVQLAAESLLSSEILSSEGLDRRTIRVIDPVTVMQTMQDQINTLKQEMETLRQSNAQLQATTHTLTERVKTQAQTIEELQENRTQLEEENSLLQIQLETQKQKTHTIQTSLNKAQSDQLLTNYNLVATQEFLSLQTIEVDRLRKELARLTVVLENSGADKAQVEVQLKETKAELQQKNLELNALLQQVSSLQTDLQANNQTIARVTKKLDEATFTERQLRERMSTLEEKAATIRTVEATVAVTTPSRPSQAVPQTEPKHIQQRAFNDDESITDGEDVTDESLQKEASIQSFEYDNDTKYEKYLPYIFTETPLPETLTTDAIILFKSLAILPSEAISEKMTTFAAALYNVLNDHAKQLLSQSAHTLVKTYLGRLDFKKDNIRKLKKTLIGNSWYYHTITIPTPIKELILSLKDQQVETVESGILETRKSMKTKNMQNKGITGTNANTTHSTFNLVTQEPGVTKINPKRILGVAAQSFLLNPLSPPKIALCHKTDSTSKALTKIEAKSAITELETAWLQLFDINTKPYPPVTLDFLADSLAMGNLSYTFMERFGDKKLSILKDYAYPYLVLKLRAEKDDSEAQIKFFKEPASAEDLLSAFEGTHHEQIAFLARAMNMMKREENGLKGNPFSKEQCLMFKAISSAEGISPRAFHAEAGAGKSTMIKLYGELFNSQKTYVLHVSPFKEPNRTGFWLNQLPQVKEKGQVIVIAVTIDELETALTNSSENSALTKQLKQGLIVLDEYDSAKYTKSRELLQKYNLNPFLTSATRSRDDIAVQLERIEHKIRFLEGLTHPKDGSTSPNYKDILDGRYKSRALIEWLSESHNPAFQESSVIATEYLKTKLALEGNSDTTQIARLSQSLKRLETTLWDYISTNESIAKEFVDHLNQKRSAKLQLLRTQLTHLDQSIDSQINRTMKFRDVALLDDTQRWNSLFDAATKAPLNAGKSSVLIELPDDNPAQIDTMVNALFVKMQPDEVVIYRNTNGEIQYKKKTRQNSFEDITKESLERASPPKTYCLYTSDSRGGDYGKFSHGYVGAQFIMYKQTPSTSEFYQHLRRYRGVALTVQPTIFINESSTQKDFIANANQIEKIDSEARTEIRAKAKAIESIKKELEEQLIPPNCSLKIKQFILRAIVNTPIDLDQSVTLDQLVSALKTEIKSRLFTITTTPEARLHLWLSSPTVKNFTHWASVYAPRPDFNKLRDAIKTYVFKSDHTVSDKELEALMRQVNFLPKTPAEVKKYLTSIVTHRLNPEEIEEINLSNDFNLALNALNKEQEAAPKALNERASYYFHQYQSLKSKP